VQQVPAAVQISSLLHRGVARHLFHPAESGWRVMPPNDTRRVPISIKNSTISGSQNLAPRGTSRSQLQRPLRRAGSLLPADGSVAGDSARRAAVRTGAGDGTNRMNASA
jgi:hypothetical protein